MTPTWPTPAQIEQSARALDPEAWAILDSDSIGMMTRRKVSLEQARAALRAVNPFEWRGMDSAPKTTTAILVFCPAYKNTYTVSWVIPLDWNAKPDPDHGFWSHFGAGGDRLNERPSKWMPIPPQEGK